MAICKYCGKEFDNSKIGGHTAFCKKNPNRIRNIELSKNNIKKMTESSLKKRRDVNYEHTKKEIICVCEKCGKEFTQYASEYSIKNNKVSRFCSRECANSHPNACEGKTKTIKCIDCGKNVEVKSQTDPKLVRCERCKKEHILKSNKSICAGCGKLFYPEIKQNGKISKTKFCSQECKKNYLVEKGKNNYKIMKANGTHKPWQSRNITSYPERFWIEVLNNNDIGFKREYFFDKKYFLDFYIVVNGKKIDLEIDGKQHLREEHIGHDEIRDEYIKSKGLHVYRIPWNEINSDAGKLLMKEKIDNFLIYYNELKTGCRE